MYGSSPAQAASTQESTRHTHPDSHKHYATTNPRPPSDTNTTPPTAHYRPPCITTKALADRKKATVSGTATPKKNTNPETLTTFFLIGEMDVVP